jgi:hypothetical protein
MDTQPVETPVETPPETYSPVVAAKDSVWGVAKLGTSIALVPKVVMALAAVGVLLDINGYVYKALPYIIFVVLHLIHDFASVKSKLGWV